MSAEDWLTSGGFDDLVAELSVATTSEAGLGSVARYAAGAVPGSEHAGITVLGDGSMRTHGATDPIVLDVDAAQYERNEGPCLESAVTGRVVHCTDMYREGRWPTFAAAARAIGIGSTASFPLVAAGRPLGALNCYSSSIDAFDEHDDVGGLALASQAALVLVGSVRYWEAQRTIEQLERAVETRQLIGQAVGIVMVTRHLGPDEAIAELTTRSQNENRKLRDIAAEIVASRGH